MRAAPVRFTGVLSFIHKTLQEFLCAETLRMELSTALHQPAASMRDMLAVLEQSAGGAAAAAAAGDEAEARRQRVEMALVRVGELLIDSAWARVALAREDAVRDFLADAYLDDEGGFASDLGFLVLWAKHRMGSGKQHASGGKVATGKKQAAGAAKVLQNVRAVLTGVLPKRKNGTLLHAAAADGSYAVLARVVALLGETLGGAEAVKEAGKQRDMRGRTPLFMAAERGHTLALALLMAAEDAPVGVRRSLVPKLGGGSTAQAGRAGAGVRVRGAGLHGAGAPLALQPQGGYIG
jgi:hypothetical protein